MCSAWVVGITAIVDMRDAWCTGRRALRDAGRRGCVHSPVRCLVTVAAIVFSLIIIASPRVKFIQ